MLIYLHILLNTYRGTSNDPIEFRVRENIADALIGQLIYKNITREEYRSTNSKTQHSAQNRRQERFLNARFSKNDTTFEKTKKSQKRRHRAVSHEDLFYVPVTPTIFYDDLVAFESSQSEKTFIPSRRKFMPTKRVLNGSIALASNKVQSSVVTTKPTKTPVDTTFMPKEILVTPRPVRMKNKNLLTDPRNTTRSDKQIKQRSQSDGARGLRFLIANQHDVTDMITITNDGTLMTVKGLDREDRDVYRLTIIAEYYQGYVTGAGIYQVVIHVISLVFK